MGGGLIFGGLGALLMLFGVRFIRDKGMNYRFTKGMTLLGLAIVCWGTFPQAQRFTSGTQILAQLIVGLVFFGVGGAIVGFLLDLYRRQDNGRNSAVDPDAAPIVELDSKERAISEEAAQLNRAYQPKTALSAEDLVRLEQITSLRDRGTLSQFQFETERDNILGAAEPLSQDSAPEISLPPPLPPTTLPPPSPPPPSSPPPVSSSTAEASVKGISSTNVGFIAVMLLPFLLIGFVALIGGTQSSPEEEPAMVSDAINEDPAVEKCSEDAEKENWQSAFASCSTAANLGVSSAQMELGYMYVSGKGVEQDYVAAATWLRKAADQGEEWAQAMLGVLYHDGLGVAKNPEAAAVWYSKAAEQGNAGAQHNLGSIYDYGEGVVEDDAEAVRWYRKAAEQGDADAKKRLEELGY
jgi:TPR repeat protein